MTSANTPTSIFFFRDAPPASAPADRLPSLVYVPPQEEQPTVSAKPRSNPAPRGRSLVRKSSGASRQLQLDTVADSTTPALAQRGATPSTDSDRPAAQARGSRVSSPSEEDRIAKLAKPKTNAPVVPVRQLQKKKVVAFGVTTNISQTVEGSSARNRARSASGNRPSPLAVEGPTAGIQNQQQRNQNPSPFEGGNKENQKQQQTVGAKTKAKAITKNTMLSTTNKNTSSTAAPSSPSDVNREVMDLVRQSQEKFMEQLTEQFSKKLDEFTNAVKVDRGAGGRDVSPPRDTDRRRDRSEDRQRMSSRDMDRLLDSIEFHLKRDADFHQIVTEMCEQTARMHRQPSLPPAPRLNLSDSSFRGGGGGRDSPLLNRSNIRMDMGDAGGGRMGRSGGGARVADPYGAEGGERRRYRPLVNEKVTMERSYVVEQGGGGAENGAPMMSPHGEPFSMDTSNYLRRRSTITRGSAPSPSALPDYSRDHRERPQMMAPMSTYQPGTSKSYYPNQCRIMEMSDEEYERQLRQREQNLGGGGGLMEEPSLDSCVDEVTHNCSEKKSSYWEERLLEKKMQRKK